MEKLYPDSGVELTPFISKYYDSIMNVFSFGSYTRFIQSAIKAIEIKPDDRILDLGCGTGRNACLMNKYISENGLITGVDVSDVMGNQFNKNCSKHSNINFVKKRIDQPFVFEEKYDKVFISFVIHGFPHEIRKIIIDNAKNNLTEGGEFVILDFAEFDMYKMPALHRFVFKAIECKYAFDYIERDWKVILKDFGFNQFEEKLYFKKYARLLKAKL